MFQIDIYQLFGFRFLVKLRQLRKVCEICPALRQKLRHRLRPVREEAEEEWAKVFSVIF